MPKGTIINPEAYVAIFMHFEPCSVRAHFPAARQSMDQGGRNQI
jgi:hypothetical protein